MKIDYILVRKRFRIQVKDSYPGSHSASSHILVLMHCVLKFKKLQQKMNSLRVSTFRKISTGEINLQENNKVIKYDFSADNGKFKNTYPLLYK